VKVSRAVALGLLIPSLLVGASLLAGCSSPEDGSGYQSSDGIDPTPEKIDGSSSYEFEEDDIERAEEAPPSVQAYCEGAVSEAQEAGCLSHVDESEVP
jgi:hypothetical protein